VAGRAHFIARDGDARLRPPDSLPEIDIQAVLEVAAFLRRRLLAATASEKLGENIAEPACAARSLLLRAGMPLAAVISELRLWINSGT
jgi:hypothetical protein